MSQLAMLGGEAAVPRRARKLSWPVITQEDKEAVLRVLSSGNMVANLHGETEVSSLEKEWAELVGTRHCVAVSSGTTAVAVALGAAGLQPGDEVIVPALSFIASAYGPLHQLLIPRFVDIDPLTYNMAPELIEAAITERTRAIMVVHLHGLPVDMDEINSIAEVHGLVVIEDAAQAQGAEYRGRPVGSLGAVAAFSLHQSKNLPTCGEGGLVTTDDPEIMRRAIMMRQFGHLYDEDSPRLYISEAFGFNYKPNPVQAAFARSQLRRFEEYKARREENILRMLHALDELPGIHCPLPPEDRSHVWHIIRLRFDPVAAGFDDVQPGPFRQALHRALRAEGAPLSYYQIIPLPAQRAFRDPQGFGGGYPWAISGNGKHSGGYRPADFPNTLAVIDSTLTLQKGHLNPEAGPLLDHCADAFRKVWENLDVVARMARSMPYEAPWDWPESGLSRGDV